MPSLQTQIQIWNMALDLLVEQPLASINDDKATAKLLLRNYAQQRDYLLERYLWKFALTREELPADSTRPAWGFAYRFALPTNALRIIPPTVDGSWNGRPIPYEQESGYILCDLVGPLRLRYISRVTTEGLFSNGFCELLSIRLALRCAHWLTGKQKLVEQLTSLYNQTADDVKQVEAVQVAGGAIYDDDILTERSEYY